VVTHAVQEKVLVVLDVGRAGNTSRTKCARIDERVRVPFCDSGNSKVRNGQTRFFPSVVNQDVLEVQVVVSKLWVAHLNLFERPKNLSNHTSKVIVGDTVLNLVEPPIQFTTRKVFAERDSLVRIIKVGWLLGRECRRRCKVPAVFHRVHGRDVLRDKLKDLSVDLEFKIGRLFVLRERLVEWRNLYNNFFVALVVQTAEIHDTLFAVTENSDTLTDPFQTQGRVVLGPETACRTRLCKDVAGPTVVCRIVVHVFRGVTVEFERDLNLLATIDARSKVFT
jgi:hypothetical protein